MDEEYCPECGAELVEVEDFRFLDSQGCCKSCYAYSVRFQNDDEWEDL